ncbi:MAG: hypothetical protein LBV31_01835 [Prevotellaceae bacterium]|nr:hypothetical protein [Prevotellaceae bacterium]
MVNCAHTHAVGSTKGVQKPRSDNGYRSCGTSRALSGNMEAGCACNVQGFDVKLNND